MRIFCPALRERSSWTADVSAAHMAASHSTPQIGFAKNALITLSVWAATRQSSKVDFGEWPGQLPRFTNARDRNLASKVLLLNFIGEVNSHTVQKGTSGSCAINAWETLSQVFFMESQARMCVANALVLWSCSSSSFFTWPSLVSISYLSWCKIL